MEKNDKETIEFTEAEAINEGNPDLYQAIDFPSLLDRIKALVIDFVIILIVFVSASLIFDQFNEVPVWLRGLIFISMIYCYEPLMVAFSGGTIGHRIIGLKVAKLNNPDQNIHFGTATVRFLAKGILGWISFLTVISSEKKRAIHDLLSGSIVLFK